MQEVLLRRVPKRFSSGFHKKTRQRCKPEPQIASGACRRETTDKVLVGSVGMKLDASPSSSIIFSKNVGSHHCLACAGRPLNDDITSGSKQISYLGSVSAGHQVFEPLGPYRFVVRFETDVRTKTPLLEQEVQESSQGGFGSFAVSCWAIDRVDLLAISVEDAFVCWPHFSNAVRNGKISPRRILLSPGHKLSLTVIMIQPRADRLGFSSMTWSAENRFVGSQSLCSNHHSNQAGAIQNWE